MPALTPRFSTPWLALLSGAPLLISGLASAETPPKKNEPPTLEALAVAAQEDAVVEGQLRAADPDGDPLSYRVTRKPRRGEVTVDEKSGAFRFVPRADWHGEDSFLIEVSDGKARTTGEVKLTVTAVNDAPTLEGASITTAEDREVSGRVRAADVDNDALTFSLSQKPTRGEVVLDGKTGAFTYKPAPDTFGADAFRVQVSDGTLTAEAGVEVTVTPVNDPPVAEAASFSGPEDTAIAGQLRARDVDGDAVRFALKGPVRNGQVTVDEVSGKVLYEPKKDFTGEDSFVFTVSDGKATVTQTARLTVTPVNDPPTAEPASASTREDVPVDVTLRARDVDQDVLTWSVATPPKNGKAEVLDAKAGRFRYSPSANFFGEDAFRATVSDGKAEATVDVKVSISAVNDAPTVEPASLTVAEDASATGSVTASDIDNDPLSFRIVQGPRRGTAELKDPSSSSFSYVPQKDFHGEDVFTLEVSDGKARVQGQVKVTVTPVNDPPVASALSLKTLEDKAVTGRVSASDIDGDALRFRVSSPAKNGDAVTDEKTGALTYTPSAGYFGADAFTVEVSDGQASAYAPVTVEVTPVNDPPVMAALALRGQEDEPARGTVTASDPEGDAIRFRLRSRARRGEVTVEEGSGAIVYVPQKDWHGEDAFVIEASDGKLSSTQEIKVSISPVNDAPIVTGGTFRTREDEPVEIRVSASDVDNDVLTFSVTSPPKEGRVEVIDAKAGRFRYTPGANFHGKDGFTVAASDGSVSPTAELFIDVTSVNDAPVASGDTFSVAEDAEVSGTLSASDVDGDKITFRIARAPKNGEVVMQDPTSGAFTYKPRANFFGSDSFLFEASDGALRATAEVKLQVTPVNDAPVAQDLTLQTAEDTPARGRLQASDVDGDALSYRVTSSPSRGRTTIDERSGSFTYTPDQDVNGADAFAIEVSDGKATTTAKVSVEILRVPDPPVVRDEVLQTREDEPITVTLPASDPDGDKLTFRLLSKPRLGTATLTDASRGELSFTPNPNVNGDDQVQFEVDDGRHKVRGVAKIRVAPVNDAPTLQALTLEAEEDQAVAGRLVGSDIDGDALTYKVHKKPAAGTVSFSKEDPSQVVFTPRANQEGEVTFEVVAFDGELASEPATVTVRIKGVNDAPVAKSQRFTIDEDRPHTGVLEAEDGDGDPLVFRITRAPTRGVVRLEDEKSGRFVYTPQRDVFGVDSFSFSVTDPEGQTATGLVRVKINEVNDPPVAIREYTEAPRYGRVTRKLKGFDPEGKPVRFRIVRQPRIGRVELRDPATGEYVFTTDGKGSGNARFEFVVNDGTFDSLPAAVDVSIR